MSDAIVRRHSSAMLEPSSVPGQFRPILTLINLTRNRTQELPVRLVETWRPPVKPVPMPWPGPTLL